MFWVFFWSLAHLHFLTFYPKDWCFIIIYALDLKSFLYRLHLLLSFQAEDGMIYGLEYENKPGVEFSLNVQY